MRPWQGGTLQDGRPLTKGSPSGRGAPQEGEFGPGDGDGDDGEEDRCDDAFFSFQCLITAWATRACPALLAASFVSATLPFTNSSASSAAIALSFA